MSDPKNRPAVGKAANDDKPKINPQSKSERDDQLDDGLRGTFPASDPISVTSSSTRTGRPAGKH